MNATFQDAIRAAGLQPPDVIEPGKFHRFAGEGKRNSNRAAWCKLFHDGIGGIFGDYSTGLSADWQAKRETPYTPVEREAFKRHVAEARAQAEAERTAKQAEAATTASSIWNAPASALEAGCPAVREHPYIKHKGIMPHGAKVYHGSLKIGGMDCNGALMLPMKLGGKIASLQFINRDGEKRFLPDGEKGGYVIGKIEAGKPVCICEGFATGASIYEATGRAVIVAFDAGNLRKIAEALRTKYSDAVIALCSDDDYQTAGNPGLTKATEAAAAVGGLLAMPVFDANRPDKATDFNDMAQLCGADAVKQAITSAAAPVPVDHQTVEAAGCVLSPSNASGNTNAPAWPTPQPLTAKIEAEPYPVDALPDTIRAAVEEVGGFVKAPVPLVASSAIAALSLAIQAHYDVERASKLHSPVSTFTLVIAESGERKSTCDGFFTKAIRDYESAQVEAAKPFVKDYNAAIESWEAKRSGIKDKIRQLAKDKKPTTDLEADLRDLGHNKPVPPRITRLIYGVVADRKLTQL